VSGMSGRLSAAQRCGVVAVLAAASLACGCRGYSPDTLFRPDIRTVQIRVFDNKTFWHGREVALTRAVEDEIKLRTPLVLAAPGKADSILSGRLESLNLDTQVRSEDDNVLISRVNAVVSFRWVDRLTGADIVPPQTVHESVRVAWATEENAAATLFQKVAQRVVEQMQAPW
jgi:hypothetical protein